MELDTGVSVTNIAKTVWIVVLAENPSDASWREVAHLFRPSRFSCWRGSRMCIFYTFQEARFPFIVTGGDGPALVGRNWLSVVRLGCKQIKQISQEPFLQ